MNMFIDEEMIDKREIECYLTKQIALETEIKELEQELKDKKKELKDVQCGKFIAALHGLDEISLNGYKIKVVTKLYVSEGGASADKIVEFLKEREASDLLQEKLVIDVYENNALIHAGLIPVLNELGLSFYRTEKYNINSVKAYIDYLRSQEINVNLPELGIYEETKTIISEM